MFSGLCGPMGVTGWLVMAALWTGLIALVVWAIARLFPQGPSPAPPSEDSQESVARPSDGAHSSGDVAVAGGER